jgi:hypothetical protein
MANGIRIAGPDDRDTLVTLMRELYVESGTPFDTAQTARAFEDLLRNDVLGLVWIFHRDVSSAGFTVLTFGYSMEYGVSMRFWTIFLSDPNNAGAGSAAWLWRPC